ncbi:hypothetical protein N656DRAFT_338834 [Canariomyces notabilis]|uniref:Uncharacterized protein n=1 Tax=Canariomyces notabilis TaxID=2074819 RepID=A0AAN6QFW9_9PEZI|nr:hypothetical protein N656DRAFT_338834 [Canariomyces arenarius]
MLPVLVVLDFTLALDAHAHDVRRDIGVIIMDYALAGFERMLLAVVLTMDGWMDGWGVGEIASRLLFDLHPTFCPSFDFFHLSLCRASNRLGKSGFKSTTIVLAGFSGVALSGCSNAFFMTWVEMILEPRCLFLPLGTCYGVYRIMGFAVSLLFLCGL